MSAPAERPKLPGSLEAHRRLSRWLAVNRDGTVAARTGKIELGQGILTALAQIVADELDVAMTRVRMHSADTDASPDEGVTAGSLSVQESGAALRQASAEVRALLLAEAAHELGAPIDALTVDDGTVRAPSGRTVTYWGLADLLDLDREADGVAQPKPREALRVVGTAVPRLDLPAKLAGAAVYLQDMKLPGMVHARVVRPAWRSARLLELDADRIRELPGVVAVVREGSFLAVVAERETQVLRAQRRAHSVSRWSDPVDAERGFVPADLVGRANVEERCLDRQDAAAAARGVRSVAARYTRPFIAHASIGPSCAVALADGDRITVWTHSQGVGPLRREMARILGRGEAQLRVVHVQGAGCYGQNGADDVALEAAIVAIAVPGRPVRMQWMREDEFAAEPYGSPMAIDVAAALDADGRVVDWTLELWSHPHAARPGAADGISLLAGIQLDRGLPVAAPKNIPLPSGASQRNAIALYDFPAHRVTSHLVPGGILRTSSLRSLGAHGNVFAIESFMDELAHAAGADPVAFRLAHLADPRARAVVEAVAAMSGWPRAVNDGHGCGIAFARYKNLGSYVAVVVEVEAGEHVRVLRAWAAVEVGRVINPDGVAAQIEGGIVQAVSWTLKESVPHDGEQVLARNWNDYPILGFDETPEVEVRVLDRPDLPSLGAGEGAQGPVSAAIANAVFAALGARVRDLPITRERVVAALV
jgi:CO/xanthine dehydrogenase Mo-binding subunit